MAQQFDLIIVGGGPGGYTTAAEAAARGERVAVQSSLWSHDFSSLAALRC